LDEADRMLDMEFLQMSVMKVLPSKTMFSATFSKDIKEMAMGILHKPEVELARLKTQQWKLLFRSISLCKEKTELIIKLITEGNWQQILVFTRTKQGANKLTEAMINAGIKAATYSTRQGAEQKH
jgi:ATP-dependent RNA helicase RhlE